MKNYINATNVLSVHIRNVLLNTLTNMDSNVRNVKENIMNNFFVHKKNYIDRLFMELVTRFFHY